MLIQLGKGLVVLVANFDQILQLVRGFDLDSVFPFFSVSVVFWKDELHLLEIFLFLPARF